MAIQSAQLSGKARVLTKALVAISAASAALGTNAAPVTLQFKGVVDTVWAGDVAPGTAVVGELSYDTSLTPRDTPSVLNDGQWVFYDIPTPASFKMKMGDMQVTLGSISAVVFDKFATAGSAADEQLYFFGSDVSINGQLHSLGEFQLGFGSRPGDTQVFDGRLPTGLDVSQLAFAVGRLDQQMTSFDGEGVESYTGPSLRFAITSVTPVPEPSTWLTFLLGAVGVGAACASRRTGRVLSARA